MELKIMHRITGAVLFSSESKSLKICLGGADLVAQLGQPNSWTAWTYVSKDGLQRIRVGCRDFSLTEGRAYWVGKDNRREVLAALDYAEAIGKLRGWKQEE